MAKPKMYPLGTVVRHETWNGLSDWTYGHVIGFSRNSSNELIIRVLTDQHTEVAIHPNNITIEC